MSNLMSDAVRLIRAGSQFSEANQKLRRAADAWIKEFYRHVKGTNLPDEWYVHRSGYREGSLTLGFSTEGGSGYSITTDWEDQPIETIHVFCRVLAGEQGRKLLEWMENQTASNNSMAEALDVFRSAIAKP